MVQALSLFGDDSKHQLIDVDGAPNVGAAETVDHGCHCHLMGPLSSRNLWDLSQLSQDRVDFDFFFAIHTIQAHRGDDVGQVGHL